MIQKLFVDTSIRALYGVFTVWKMLRRSGARPARLFTIKNRTRRTERKASRQFELGLLVCNVPGRLKTRNCAGSSSQISQVAQGLHLYSG